MIIVKLMGGLGNQMFQYAAGRALAHRHNAALKFDMSFLHGSQENDTPRHFMLDTFNISAECALSMEIPYLGANPSFYQQCKSIYLRRLHKCCTNVLIDYDHRLNDSFFSAPDNSYLEGYWQSEKYFIAHAKTIRNDFTPLGEPEDVNRQLSLFMEKTNSVSIHIRRGDYVNNPRINSVHGVCSLEYYQHCVKNISAHVDNPEYFVFSDEPDWVKKHLQLDGKVTVVDNNTPEMPVWDLWLMSKCKHNIIANSSFSWWGAWLNSNPDKIVFAPKQWFSDGNVQPNIIPEQWRLL